MRRRSVHQLLRFALPVAALLPAPLSAQGWLTQTYTVSARVEADAEAVAHPDRHKLLLVVPADVPDAEVCVEAGSTAAQTRGRNRVRVIVSRATEGGEDDVVGTAEFEWSVTDPPIHRSRCETVGALEAGDAVEFRFRFFDMPPLRLLRRGKRIAVLPLLEVTGTVRHDPFTG